MEIRPSMEEIINYSKEYKTIPLSTELVMNYTPIGIIKKIKAVSSHCFMLESREDSKQTGRYTFIGFDPKAEVSCTNYDVQVIDEFGVTRLHDNPRGYVKAMLDKHKSPRLDYLPTFTGGLVGYFGYDYIKYSEPGINLDAEDDGNFKDVDLMLFDKVIAFDHLEEKIIIIVNMQTDELEANYESAVRELQIITKIIDEQPIAEPEAPVLKSDFKALFNGEEYGAMVEKAKHYIREGDIFQGVISRRFEADYQGSLINTYRVLRTTNPSPYMYFIGCDDLEIAGTSPETMVKLLNGKLTTFPVAGTRKRGETKEIDEALETELLADEKECSEHNMLVDLARNDIGRIAEFGTVEVEEYMKIHRFSKVMHIASTVVGKIRDDKDGCDTISALLPAGTLSGAPKFRACEIIDELEPVARGVYGGAIGYLDFSGNLDVCIAIRTAVKKGNKVYVQAGAGIVADSVPENEYMECANKAGAVIEAVKRASEVNG